MAGIIQLIGAIIGLVIKLIDLWRETDKDKKAKKTEALNVVKDGITTRDASKLTLGFNLYNRL